MSLGWWDAGALLAVALLTLDALRRVWKGGTTLNDHAVAVAVFGCAALFPTLGLGARLAGVGGAVVDLLLVAGVVGIWGLFWVMDQRREASRAEMALAVASQLAYAFSLWAGLLVLVRAPVAWAVGAPLLWPGALLLVPLALALWGVGWTWLRRHQVRHLDLEVPGTGRVRVVQLSDLHASPTMRGADLQELVSHVARLAPDLVVVTGDLVMPFSEANHGWLIRALEDLRRLCPVVASPGNHDLPVSETLGAELAAVGVPWLVDAQVALRLGPRGGESEVDVLGLDFRWRDAAGHVAEVLAEHPRDPSRPRLLLAHDPRYFEHVPPGAADLVLAGHTHGGQVGLQMFGLRGSLLGMLGVRAHGLFERPGARMWVHAGNWHTGLPPRMGVAPELLVVELRGDAAPATPARSTSAR